MSIHGCLDFPLQNRSPFWRRAMKIVYQFILLFLAISLYAESEAIRPELAIILITFAPGC
jgi:hypothetical protein